MPNAHDEDIKCLHLVQPAQEECLNTFATSANWEENLPSPGQRFFLNPSAHLSQPLPVLLSTMPPTRGLYCGDWGLMALVEPMKRVFLEGISAPMEIAGKS